MELFVQSVTVNYLKKINCSKDVRYLGNLTFFLLRRIKLLKYFSLLQSTPVHLISNLFQTKHVYIIASINLLKLSVLRVDLRFLAQHKIVFLRPKKQTDMCVYQLWAKQFFQLKVVYRLVKNIFFLSCKKFYFTDLKDFSVCKCFFLTSRNIFESFHIFLLILFTSLVPF